MSRPKINRQQLIFKAMNQLTIMGTSSVMLSQTIATRLGLNPTDLESLEIISRTGRITAGSLAQLSGLTTGAITGVIDRLEKREFVKREFDATDRRKVLVTLNKVKAEKEIYPFYESIAQGMEDILEKYSGSELATITGYLEIINAKTIEEIKKIKNFPH